MTWHVRGFQNHKATLTSLTLFQLEVRREFAGKQPGKADDTLILRIHLPIDTVSSLIEDVLRLLRRADPNATEERMIHLLI